MYKFQDKNKSPKYELNTISSQSLIQRYVLIITGEINKNVWYPLTRALYSLPVGDSR